MIPQNMLKDCYGTTEFSKNSGICKNCNIKEECEKVSPKNFKKNERRKKVK